MTAENILCRAGRRLKRAVLGQNLPSYLSSEANALAGYRCHAGVLEVLEAWSGVADTLLSKGVLQSPGFVEVDGNVFDLRRDGLYRFYRLPSVSEQRVVCTGGVESILHTMGYLFGYGNDDDARTQEQLVEQLRHRRVVGGCGTLAKVANRILSSLGIESRIVILMTLGQWGGQDDGHTLLEIRNTDKTWFLYDPSFGTCFRRQGRRLSATDFSCARNDEVELERLPANPGYARFDGGSYDYDFWIAERFMSQQRLLDWYRRVGALPLLAGTGGLCCPRSLAAEGNVELISTHFSILEDEEFRRNFYPT